MRLEQGGPQVTHYFPNGLLQHAGMATNDALGHHDIK